MSISSLLLLAASGAAFGCLITWLAFRSASAVLRSSLSSLQKDLSSARNELSAATQQNAGLHKSIAGLEATLAHERKAGEQELALGGRDRQPGEGAALAERPWTVGRNTTEARRRNCRHAFLLRLRGAGKRHYRFGTAAS